ncbi:Uncharacterized conserved protein, contains ParB-like and HNH nuclease domains [Flavobacterium omnivorum]|uniref:Uncharacterized conserved protein, contains ParB-like and HNH nuclease domains n=1 Tax=Flavobacterium omnivorum TaxID=178355 RepID=A0A1G7XCH8_9FLAO|nr:DUF262 domain-containing protein [Flavobacterium omnivorum]SDG81942.1 Uncharacterized conserved protein, contains ParB-like and HNH nuclease domains [Flavobacterium omnivorum]
MLTNHQDIQDFSIGKLFTSPNRYLIPIYQRNYEWDDKQIVQLIEDIKDYYIEEEHKNYYIGSLIVDYRQDQNGTFYETIDGQQRLTTFNLLICALRIFDRNKRLPESSKPFINNTIIHFESRPISDKSIQFIFNNGTEQPNFSDFNENIISGIKIIYCQLDLLAEKFESDTKEKTWNGKTFEGFLAYLFNKVIIVRVQVPINTDLNHYFEIMNSRGEQLEKHEILKSRLMKELNVCENAVALRKQFNLVWEACSEMGSYVQMLFNKDVRSKLFGERWFQFIPENEQELFEILEKTNKVSTENDYLSFSDIVLEDNYENLQQKITQLSNDDIVNDSDSKQFQHIINFENFLLHVLKQTAKLDVSLDDKRILSFFHSELNKNDDKVTFVKDFLYQLLKNKFLLDQYILKREYLAGDHSWSLKILKFYPKVGERIQESFSYVNTFGSKDSNDELLLLSSMFHVSTPTLVYKYWLFAALKYLSENYDFEKNVDSLENPTNIEANEYIQYLVSTAQKFLKYRFLNKNSENSYEDIIENELKFGDAILNEELLQYGKIRNNLVFNYIDYLLWIEKKDSYKDFSFSFRSSVEHYYPQNPISGERIDDEFLLNCIGNLCLISHSNNSKLSNYLPNSKKEHYTNSKSKDSIKQMEMMKEENWHKEEIKKSHTFILNLLKQDLNLS